MIESQQSCHVLYMCMQKHSKTLPPFICISVYIQGFSPLLNTKRRTVNPLVASLTNQSIEGKSPSENLYESINSAKIKIYI